jgi:hypothetical protein
MQRRLSPLIALCLVVGATATLSRGTPAHADSVPPAGTITRLAQTAPNFAYHGGGASGANTPTTATTAYTDSSNHVLIEYNPTNPTTSNCPNLAVFDSDTYAFKTDDATFPFGPATCVNGVNLCQAGNSKSAAVAIDSADQLLFAYSGACLFPQSTQGAIQIISERTLSVLAQVPLPSQAKNVVGGLSWYPAQRQLIVETDNGNTHSGFPVAPGVALSAYGLTVTPGSAPNLSELWTVAVPGCTFGLTPVFATNNPYRSALEPAAYVACQLTAPQAVSDNRAERDGVVKLALGSSCAPGADRCPTGGSVLAVVPGQATDFIFDPGSDRGFMPAQTLSGITVLVYDGHRAAFIGRTGVGTASEPNQGAFALDPQTGRLYTVMPVSSMTVLDGRRTPVSVGSRFPAFANYVNHVTVPVLEPDATFPYPTRRTSTCTRICSR